MRRILSLKMNRMAETIFYKGFVIMISKHWKMGMGEMVRCQLTGNRYVFCVMK